MKNFKQWMEGEAEDFQSQNDQLVGMTEEDPSPDELMRASLGKKTDGKDVLDELGEAKKKFPKFDQGKEVRSIARERIGQPRFQKVIIKSKKDKPEKYKQKYD